MPALSDKIFLPSTIFVVSVVLTIFRFVLVSAVGACFAIYAKYGGEYAKSVGWVQSSGYREMVKTSWSIRRRKNVPESVKWALVAALLGTLAASLLDKGISHFINPALSLGQSVKEIRESLHFGFGVGPFLGWHFVVPVNGSAVKTMKTALNSTLVIRNLIDGQSYIPVSSPYRTACTAFGIKLEDQPVRDNTNGCGTVNIKSGNSRVGPGSFMETQVFNRSSNRWRVLLASGRELEEMSREIRYMLDYKMTVEYLLRDPTPLEGGASTAIQCTLEEHYRPIMEEGEGSGFTAYPVTSTTKCFFNATESENIMAIALTSTRFRAPTGPIDDLYPAEFVRTNFTNEADDLLLAMQESVKIKKVRHIPWDSPPQNSTEINVDVWAELRVTDSTIDAYICEVTYRKIKPRIECFYGTTRVLPFKSPYNYDLFKYRNSTEYTHYDERSYISLEYLTNNYNGAYSPISVKKMSSDTVDVTNYMADLGYNFYADFGGDDQQGKVYIQYNVSSTSLGLEVPLWVLVIAGIILTVSFCVWQLIHRLVGSPYTSSVYSIIRKRLASYTNTSIPKLMRFKFQPLMFENVTLLPDEIEFSSKANTEEETRSSDQARTSSSVISY
ncbi:hypothetical protein BGX34_002994 [Mortierella sp. NVP85]|nr:hypothetical protein BGX34_002994 [Mortierella sp. NVP85]